MAKHGFTTRILHNDRQLSVEHGAVHKPIHTSSQYAYPDARELAAGPTFALGMALFLAAIDERVRAAMVVC